MELRLINLITDFMKNLIKLNRINEDDVISANNIIKLSENMTNNNLCITSFF